MIDELEGASIFVPLAWFPSCPALKAGRPDMDDEKAEAKKAWGNQRMSTALKIHLVEASQPTSGGLANVVKLVVGIPSWPNPKQTPEIASRFQSVCGRGVLFK